MSFYPCGFQGSSSGHQAWWRVSLPAKSSHGPSTYFLNLTNEFSFGRMDSKMAQQTEMVQQVKTPVTKTDDLSLIPRTQMVKGKERPNYCKIVSDFCKTFSDFSKSILTCSLPQLIILKKKAESHAPKLSCFSKLSSNCCTCAVVHTCMHVQIQKLNMNKLDFVLCLTLLQCRI